MLPGDPGYAEHVEMLTEAYFRHAAYGGPDEEAARLSAEGYAAQLEALGVEVPGLPETFETVAVPGIPGATTIADLGGIEDITPEQLEGLPDTTQQYQETFTAETPGPLHDPYTQMWRPGPTSLPPPDLLAQVGPGPGQVSGVTDIIAAAFMLGGI
jgi:hypothetical protein